MEREWLKCLDRRPPTAMRTDSHALNTAKMTLVNVQMPSSRLQSISFLYGHAGNNASGGRGVPSL
jgi:hypothetical protein